MDTDKIKTGLALLVSDLTLAGEPIALDVVIARHLPLLQEARSAKLRWTSLARLLAEAGARRPNGSSFSVDQLRASYSRAERSHRSLPDQEALFIREDAGAKRKTIADLPSNWPRGPTANCGLEEAIEQKVPSQQRGPKHTKDQDFTAIELESVQSRLRQKND